MCDAVYRINCTGSAVKLPGLKSVAYLPHLHSYMTGIIIMSVSLRFVCCKKDIWHMVCMCVCVCVCVRPLLWNLTVCSLGQQPCLLSVFVFLEWLAECQLYGEHLLNINPSPFLPRIHTIPAPLSTPMMLSTMLGPVLNMSWLAGWTVVHCCRPSHPTEVPQPTVDIQWPIWKGSNHPGLHLVCNSGEKW